MDLFFDGIFHGLFSAIDPLGMVLRTLMALLADALAQAVTGMYAQLFEITTADFTMASLGSIWKITTGVSASVATILLVMAAFRAMVAQSSRYLVEAIPGVALALIGPQVATLLLPAIAAAFTDLAQVIVSAATPDLAASMRLLAGVGSNALYEGLGLMAPLIATLLLFGLTSVFFVLLFCMAAAVVLYALSPFAFAGLVMAPTRTWFRKWATLMFSVLFAKVPIAILLALSVSLFANSAHTGTTQAFVNAGAGLILGIGALLAPLMAYGLFSFMGTVATKPAVPSTNPARALGTAYYGSQMGRAGVNAGRKVVTSARSITSRSSAGDPGCAWHRATGGGDAGSARAHRRGTIRRRPRHPPRHDEHRYLECCCARCHRSHRSVCRCDWGDRRCGGRGHGRGRRGRRRRRRRHIQGHRVGEGRRRRYRRPDRKPCRLHPARKWTPRPRHPKPAVDATTPPGRVTRWCGPGPGERRATGCPSRHLSRPSRPVQDRLARTVPARLSGGSPCRRP
ncbi:MAG: hypothetical protein IPO93_15740 [Actinobacteria bacterium]|nr:hypothetical protein [Actinomycetota bacterium]